MKTVLFILSIFSLIWLQHFCCGLDRWRSQLVRRKRWFMDPKGSKCPTNWNWELEPTYYNFIIGLRLEGDPHRLRKYLNAYRARVNLNKQIESEILSKAESRLKRESSVKAPEIIENEFITNPAGEYSLNFKLNNTLRRVEIGAFEKTDNGTEFIIRGLIFGYNSSFWTYKANSTSFRPNQYPGAVEIYADLAAKGILCGCCALHDTCSNLCNPTASVYEECSPNVVSDENLPKIKEQSFIVDEDGSYELRVFFNNNFYERSELYEDSSIFGFLPKPKKPEEDLQYYVEGDTRNVFTELENFPGILPCEVRPVISAGVPSDFYTNIDQKVLKTLVG